MVQPIPNYSHSKKKKRASLHEIYNTVYFAVLDLLPQAAPEEPVEEVKNQLLEIGMGQAEINAIHKIYQRLRMEEGKRRENHRMTLSSDAVLKLVPDYREQVSFILKGILQMGGCYELVDWDHFLFVLARFCSLSKVEIAQLLFLIIVRECRGLDVHYLTSAQLDRFYDRYRSPSTPSGMDCSKIHFSNFPLSRYYVTDFIEICFLYGPLVNPILFLQRKFQQVLPSLRFWDNYDYISGANRRITIDFFLIRKTGVSLNTNTSFQETCDLLLLSSNLVYSKLKEISPTTAASNDDGEDAKYVSKLPRAMELDFVSKNRKIPKLDEFAIKQVYSQQPLNPILKAKISDN